MPTRDANGHVLLPVWFLKSVVAAVLAALLALSVGGVQVFSDVKVIKAQVQSLDGRMERLEDATIGGQ